MLMKTRMDKYTETPILKSRSEKNKDLYEQIKNTDIEKYDINSNATIIDEDVNAIDVDKIRDMLDKRYRDAYPKRKLTRDEEPVEIEEKVQDTKEYDINAILEKARKNQNVDYEKERLKRVHDTQYDILKNLNIEDRSEEIIEETDENIMSLINTITALEMRNKEKENATALDLLSDLSENDTETIYKTMELDKEKISEKTTENLDEEDLSIEEKYDDFKELEDSMRELIFKNFIVAHNTAVIYFMKNRVELENTKTKKMIRESIGKMPPTSKQVSGITPFVEQALIEREINVESGFGNFDLIIKGSTPIGVIILGKENEDLNTFVDDYIYYHDEYEKRGWKVEIVSIIDLISSFDKVIDHLCKEAQ